MPHERSVPRKLGRRHFPPDPEPWESARRPPGDRPRHESAQPTDPDDAAEKSASIAAESWGEIVEVSPDETVDGDFNGNPELEGLARTERWEGVDALEGMAGREREMTRESTAPEEVLAEAVAERRSVLEGRLDEARELGLGPLFEAALAATEPGAGNSPLVDDDEVLREKFATIDSALDELERKSTG